MPDRERDELAKSVSARRRDWQLTELLGFGPNVATLFALERVEVVGAASKLQPVRVIRRARRAGRKNRVDWRGHGHLLRLRGGCPSETESLYHGSDRARPRGRGTHLVDDVPQMFHRGIRRAGRPRSRGL